MPIYPVRRCLKNIGPGDDSLMAIVTGISTTGEAISTTELIAMSQTRFIERLTADVSGLLRVDNTGSDRADGERACHVAAQLRNKEELGHIVVGHTDRFSDGAVVFARKSVVDLVDVVAPDKVLKA